MASSGDRTTLPLRACPAAPAPVPGPVPVPDSVPDPVPDPVALPVVFLAALPEGLPVAEQSLPVRTEMLRAEPAAQEQFARSERDSLSRTVAPPSEAVPNPRLRHNLPNQGSGQVSRHSTD
jgi:hypothetical protein